MARFVEHLGRGSSVAQGMRFSICALSFFPVWVGWALRAQEVPVPKDGTAPTLHVYTNLLQVPTLVLTMNQDLIHKPIAESRFSVSIDSGRWFRATHVRREGDDPISLSILMDMSGETTTLLPKIGDAIANLAPLSLYAKDRVSVYALGCSLVRSRGDTPPVLKSSIAAVLERSMLHSNQPKKNCELKGHLWDGLAQVAVALSDLPGRRVILVITDGLDMGSKHSWDELREYAQVKGIAIFALKFARGGYPTTGGAFLEKPLMSVCELSGGIVMRMSKPAALSKSLERFVTMLRERYIVEFPRPR